MNCAIEEDAPVAPNPALRYPCMPSLVGVQQMRNRLQLAYAGRKLMNWTALTTGRELNVLAKDITKAYECMGEQAGYCYILLARARYLNPCLNHVVLNNVPEQASVKVDACNKLVAGVEVLQLHALDYEIDNYPHLGISRGGQTLVEVKRHWRELVKKVVLVCQQRITFMDLDKANKTATKQTCMLVERVIPNMSSDISAHEEKLEEQQRDQHYRMTLLAQKTRKGCQTNSKGVLGSSLTGTIRDTVMRRNGGCHPDCPFICPKVDPMSKEASSIFNITTQPGKPEDINLAGCPVACIKMYEKLLAMDKMGVDTEDMSECCAVKSKAPQNEASPHLQTYDPGPGYMTCKLCREAKISETEKIKNEIEKEETEIRLKKEKELELKKEREQNEEVERYRIEMEELEKQKKEERSRLVDTEDKKRVCCSTSPIAKLLPCPHWHNKIDPPCSIKRSTPPPCPKVYVTHSKTNKIDNVFSNSNKKNEIDTICSNKIKKNEIDTICSNKNKNYEIDSICSSINIKTKFNLTCSNTNIKTIPEYNIFFPQLISKPQTTDTGEDGRYIDAQLETETKVVTSVYNLAANETSLKSIPQKEEFSIITQTEGGAEGLPKHMSTETDNFQAQVEIKKTKPVCISNTTSTNKEITHNHHSSIVFRTSNKVCQQSDSHISEKERKIVFSSKSTSPMEKLPLPTLPISLSPTAACPHCHAVLKNKETKPLSHSATTSTRFSQSQIFRLSLKCTKAESKSKVKEKKRDCSPNKTSTEEDGKCQFTCPIGDCEEKEPNSYDTEPTKEVPTEHCKMICSKLKNKPVCCSKKTSPVKEPPSPPICCHKTTSPIKEHPPRPFCFPKTIKTNETPTPVCCPKSTSPYKVPSPTPVSYPKTKSPIKVIPPMPVCCPKSTSPMKVMPQMPVCCPKTTSPIKKPSPTPVSCPKISPPVIMPPRYRDCHTSNIENTSVGKAEKYGPIKCKPSNTSKKCKPCQDVQKDLLSIQNISAKLFSITKTPKKNRACQDTESIKTSTITIDKASKATIATDPLCDTDCNKNVCSKEKLKEPKQSIDLEDLTIDEKGNVVIRRDLREKAQRDAFVSIKDVIEKGESEFRKVQSLREALNLPCTQSVPCTNRCSYQKPTVMSVGLTTSEPGSLIAKPSTKKYDMSSSYNAIVEDAFTEQYKTYAENLKLEQKKINEANESKHEIKLECKRILQAVKVEKDTQINQVDVIKENIQTKESLASPVIASYGIMDLPSTAASAKGDSEGRFMSEEKLEKVHVYLSQSPAFTQLRKYVEIPHTKEADEKYMFNDVEFGLRKKKMAHNHTVDKFAKILKKSVHKVRMISKSKENVVEQKKKGIHVSGHKIVMIDN